MRRLLFLSYLVCLCCLVAGCSSEPPIYPLSGKVTLGGKPYERLLVYFRPIDAEVTPFNLGVGETDGSGLLKLNSTAGNGLAAGRYRVSFSCISSSGGNVGLATEKNDDDRRAVTKERVPAPYNDGENSPVEFEIESVENNSFEFDIPTTGS